MQTHRKNFIRNQFSTIMSITAKNTRDIGVINVLKLQHVSVIFWLRSFAIPGVGIG
jgi:hypothetical protein